MKLNRIEPWIRTFISDREMYVLRRKSDGMALNCSYSPDGLRWTMDKRCRLLYFQNAELSHRSADGKVIPYFKGLSKNGLEVSKHYYVEKFVPTDHTYPNSDKLNARLQAMEYVQTHRALKLLYNVEPPRNQSFSTVEEFNN